VSWLILATDHEAQTAAARSFYLVFCIENKGSGPAQKIRLHISLSKDVEAKASVPTRRWLERPPDVPDVLARMFPPPPKRREPEPIEWYVGWAADPIGMKELLRPEFFRADCEDSELQSFQVSFDRLEHGYSQLTRPLHLNFGDKTAFDFDVIYQLHATNQPSDVKGKFHLRFIETVDPPSDRSSRA